MDLKKYKVRSFNLLVFLLIALQLIVLMVTLLYFISNSVSGQLPVTTIIGAVMLLLFCVPICFVLYRSNTDEVSKPIFLALSMTFLLVALSGIIWYILPININWELFIPVAKLLSIFSYIPIAYVLFKIFLLQRQRLHDIIQKFIIYLNIFFSVFILYYIIIYMTTDINKSYDTFIFSMSMLGDEIILVLTTFLLLVNIPTNRKYLLSIVFALYTLSFLGDAARLLGYLNIYDLSYYSESIYGVMFLLTSVTLLIYALSNIKIITIEEMNKKLQDTSIFIEDLISQSPDSMCMCNAEGYILKANESFVNLFDLNPEEASGKLNIFEEDVARNKFSADILKAKNGETVHFDCKKTFNQGKDQTFMSVKLFPTYTSDGKISRYVFIAEDITARKNAEDAIKAANEHLETRVKERTIELSVLNTTLQNEIYEHNIDEERIKASLKEKEVLLKEIHHRVKNNMQIISSMLGLQSAYVQDKKYNEMLQDSQNRIKSMALIHEKLYQSDNMAKVNFTDYINSLISNLYSSYNINKEKVKLNVNLENVSFNIDTAIPLGLIINELISNSFKHAFPNDREGEIDIDINKIDDTHYRLKISDNGIGFKQKTTYSKTLGLNLVNALTEQIEGKLSINTENGAIFIITFNYI
jgi:PAS domain S-box-containing protein